jgi:hypothetical protein
MSGLLLMLLVGGVGGLLIWLIMATLAIAGTKWIVD